MRTAFRQFNQQTLRLISMTPIGEFQVRIAIRADLEPIRLIMRCPDIHENQYRIDESLWLEFAEKTILATQPAENRIDVLDVAGSVVGYVVTRRQVYRDSQYGYLSFNLLPECWGRGFMEIAIRKIIHELFQEERVHGVMVECFSGNSQCQRLLQKLSFRSVPIPVFERLVCLVTRLPIRWVLRFWLSKDSVSVTS